MSYAINPLTPLIAATHPLTLSPQHALALVVWAWRLMSEQTNGLARPDTLWLSPEAFHYFQCTRASEALNINLAQAVLSSSPTIRKLGEQPVLQTLGENQSQAMVLFNAQAVAKPDCIGWLVGGEAIYRPMETIVVVGV